MTHRFVSPGYSSRRPSGEAGSLLLETLVALTIIALCLLLNLALFAQEPAVIHRLDAHREVIEVLDTVHEAVRSGLPLPVAGSEPFDWRGLDPTPQVSAAEDLRLWIEVGDAASTRDLLRLTLRARYRVAGRDYERTLETLVGG